VSDKKQGRGSDWVFIEILCGFFAVAGMNIKLSDDRVKKERLTQQNEDFKFQVYES
jgi:hypothetical protein